MPGIGGRELAKMLLAQRPGISVLYLSGYTEDAVVTQGALGPGTGFLQKPFTLAESRQESPRSHSLPARLAAYSQIHSKIGRELNLP